MDVSAQESTELPRTEPMALVEEESTVPVVEKSLPQESVAPEAEVAIPIVHLEVTTPVFGG